MSGFLVYTLYQRQNKPQLFTVNKLIKNVILQSGRYLSKCKNVLLNCSKC